MFIFVKELIALLVLSIPTFAIAKSTALLFMEEADFKRRRNVWVIVTIAAFLSPNFWVFVLIAAPTLYWGGKRDANPLAFYLLLMNVVPPISVEIPTIGINHLFDLNIFRLLSFCVLIPAALRLRKAREPAAVKDIRTLDLLLIGLGVLQVAFYVPPDGATGILLQNSFTNILRDAFLFFVDVYVLYYVASRSCTNRRALQDALAAFVISCTLMAVVAVFESVKHWLLYNDLNALWGGNPLDSEYLIRAGLLRTEASSGHPLVLGYLLAIAFGFWLYLKTRVNRRAIRMTVTAVLLAGLFVSFSRGPWGGALVIFIAYSAFGPHSNSKLLKLVAASLVVGILLVGSPAGQQLRSMLPFAGNKQASASLLYRERLVNRSWELIQASPLFGDQLALSKMQKLRQGQGIIDIVNAYVNVTLFHGFLGLALFLAFILGALAKGRSATRSLAQADADIKLLGASLAACIVGTLLMLADCGLELGYAILFYVLAGLSATLIPLRARIQWQGRTSALPAVALRSVGSS